MFTNIINRSFWLLFFVFLIACQGESVHTNVPELSDLNPETYYTGEKGVNKLLFCEKNSLPVRTYKIWSTGEGTLFDPSDWVLKGTYDDKTWVILDDQKDQKFISRYQEAEYTIEHPSNYKKYMLEIAASSKDIVKIAEVDFVDKNDLSCWNDFAYPEVHFEMRDPDMEGSLIYQQLVQDPESYIRYHARKVSEILYYTARDSMPDIQLINYVLKDYEGISEKSGSPPEITISYSTRHIEKSAAVSLYILNYETRGVLYHELVHGYQFEPKGIGTYNTNKEFRACIEGIADAVRADAGFFDIQALRKPGGHWLDGYKTTGFFLQWLTTKDPDAIRKFNVTARDLEVWSFDGAIKAIFGEDTGIENLWSEYQTYLNKQS